jgi:CRISPR system Cascade subunit CasB
VNTEEKIKTSEERFVDYLNGLVTDEERAALATLRRSLGKPAAEAAEVHRYILPRVPKNASEWDEDAYYLVGGLFALHQINWQSNAERPQATNLGASFAWLAREIESDSIEKRFVALLNSHGDDLPTHLRHAVSLLKSKEIPIDWARLLRDLRGWNREDRRIQRNWARAFWGGVQEDNEQSQPETLQAAEDAASAEL